MVQGGGNAALQAAIAEARAHLQEGSDSEEQQQQQQQLDSLPAIILSLGLHDLHEFILSWWIPRQPVAARSLQPLE